MIEVTITNKKINIAQALKNINDPKCGASVMFVGTVREINESKKVVKISYTAHEKMALKQLNSISEKAVEKYGLTHVYVEHRVGELLLGEISVVIVISSGHRKEAFEGAQYIIDELKKDVPIWKEEFYSDKDKQWL